MREYQITEKDLGAGYLYTVPWSPYGLMDRIVIHNRVPAESGIYQIWVKEGSGVSLLTTETAFYGGLRSSLREIIDEMAPAGKSLRDRIGEREAWFRYAISPSRRLLRVVKSWYEGDRIEGIDIYEIDSPGRFRLPPEDVGDEEAKRLKESDYGPPLKAGSSPFPPSDLPPGHRR